MIHFGWLLVAFCAGWFICGLRWQRLVNEHIKQMESLRENGRATHEILEKVILSAGTSR